MKKLGIAVILGMTVLGTHAQAQSISALETRIARLEAEAAKVSAAGPGAGVPVLGSPGLTFYGFVRGEMYYDDTYRIGANSNGFSLVNSTTPKADGYGAHAYQTRFGLRGLVDTEYGPLKYNFETDFYGGTGGTFRIRHAYGELAGFMLGQTWSNWNADGNPSNMLDFNGVPGGSVYRVIQARYTAPLSETLAVSFSIEDDPAPWKGRPNLTTALRYKSGTTMLKATAISRGIEDRSGDVVDAWGVSLSGILQPWEGGTLSGSFVTGKGISSTVNYFFGVGQQAGAPSPNSTFDVDANGNPIKLTGYSVGLSQAISPKVDLGAAIGHFDYSDFAGSTPTSVDDLTAATLTVRYKPVANVTLGVEYLMLDRKEIGGASVNNDRILAVAQFSF